MSMPKCTLCRRVATRFIANGIPLCDASHPHPVRQAGGIHAVLKVKSDYGCNFCNRLIIDGDVLELSGTGLKARLCVLCARELAPILSGFAGDDWSWPGLSAELGQPVRVLPPMLCTHANEVPHICPCADNCYCRVDGSCKRRRKAGPSTCSACHTSGISVCCDGPNGEHWCDACCRCAMCHQQELPPAPAPKKPRAQKKYLKKRR